MARPEALTLAFVLHRRDYGDTSLLVEVFAAGAGRFPAIAKGARRKKSIASALLQPFQPLWIGATGRGEVRTLTRVEGAGAAIGLEARAMIGGFYVNELLMRLLARNDPHDALFAFYQSALAALAEAADLETVLRQFELRLLEELGYGVTLDRTALEGVPVSSDLSYAYDPEHGVRAAEACEGGTLISGATLLALAAGEALEPGQRREARTLLRAALAPHLGDKPLQSRELYRSWFGSGS